MNVRVYHHSARVSVIEALLYSTFFGWLSDASRLTQFVLVILVCLSSS